MKLKYSKWLVTAGAVFYLMRPPINWNNYVMKEADLSHWVQVQSFDSAAACEKYREWNAHQQEPSVIPPGRDPVPGTTWSEQANLSQCVSADDKRLLGPQFVRPYAPVYP